MANRPAPANSGMLKPRTKSAVTPSPNPKQPLMSQKRSAMAGIDNARMKASKTGGNAPVTYAQAKSKLKKMMRSGM